MRIRVVLLVFALTFISTAQGPMSVAQLTTFLRSSIKLKQDDKSVAEYLKRVHLTERLDARMIEELQGQGLGPKAVQALRDLSATSGSLPMARPPAPAPVPAEIPPPSVDEQKRVLGAATEHALTYLKSLPDFICTQVTRRYVDFTGRESWGQAQDTILERLSYFEGHEDYKVVTVNNRPTDLSHDKLGGTTSSGEFGSILKEIFNPATETVFDWSHWATLRAKRMYAFTYRVPQSHSSYRITHFESATSSQSAVPGYHGQVYVEKESLRVMKITLIADELPPTFPIRQVNLSLNYDYTKIGDTDYVLPLQAELRSRDDRRVVVKNDVEFRLYRKFGADASIKFDTPDPLPDEKLKEQK